MKRTPPKPVKLTPEQIRDIEAAVFPLAESQVGERLFLLGVDFEKEAGLWFLRVYIEGRGFAVSLDDCETVSRKLDPLLDEMPLLKDIPYNLEVSSPGAFRPLKTQREFDFYVGRAVRIGTKTPAGKKPASKPTAKSPHAKEGILQSFDAARKTVTITDMDSDKTIELALEPETEICLNPVLHFPEEPGQDAAGEPTD